MKKILIFVVWALAVVVVISASLRSSVSDDVKFSDEIFFAYGNNEKYYDYLWENRDELRGLGVSTNDYFVSTTPYLQEKIRQLVHYTLYTRFRPVFIFTPTIPGMHLSAEDVTKIVGEDLIKCDPDFTIVGIIPNREKQGGPMQYSNICSNYNFNSWTASRRGILKQWEKHKKQLTGQEHIILN